MIHLLAAPSDENVYKVIFGIIAFVIWAISNMTTAASKKRQQSEEGSLATETEEWERRLPKNPPPPLPNPPVVLRRVEPPVKAKKQFLQKIPKPPKLKKPVVVSVPEAITPLPQVHSAYEKPPATVSTAHPPGPATAASIRAWLRPASLRQQFILTELFQPPLSMREKPRLPGE